MAEAIAAEDPLRHELAEIRRAVEAARRDRAIHGDIYIVWGAIVALGTIIEAAAIYLQSSLPWIGWPVLVAVGGVYSAIVGRRRAQEARVLTHAARVEAQVWLAATVPIIIVSFVGGITGAVPYPLITPLISVILGIPIATTGALYDNRHLRLAALGFFACGAVSLFLVRPLPQLLFAAMMIVGYVWPGAAMLRAERLRR